MQTSRFEYKYLVRESMARELRQVVQMHLKADDFTSGEGYPVHSLYLDAPDLRLCQQTVCGEKNRFKLRIRFYDDAPEQPIFLEVKRRVTVAVLKKRACIRRDAFEELIHTFVPDERFLVKRDPKNIDGLHVFCELARAIDARPAAYTSYIREAYESANDNSHRITFDRHLKAGSYTGSISAADRDVWPTAPVDGVVFEMKFTDRFPSWMQEIASDFQLQKISVPKYVECVNVVEDQRCREKQLPRRFVLDAPLRLTEQTLPESRALETALFQRAHPTY